MNTMNDYEYNEGIEFYGLMPKFMEATSIKTIGKNELEVIDYQETAWGGMSPEPEPEPETDYVDLSLPSGTLWAKENIKDANGNELYFAWGGTQGYSSGQVGTNRNFEWKDYEFGNNTALTRYNSTDKLTALKPEDDAATVNWDSDWIMPTYEQFNELAANTTTAWTVSDNGISGVTFTSTNNGNTLFFPAVGFASFGLVDGVNNYGYYWSSNLDNDVQYAWKFNFDSTKHGMYKSSRFMGHSVRPVRKNN